MKVGVMGRLGEWLRILSLGHYRINWNIDFY
jgi:hypothetical protein